MAIPTKAVLTETGELPGEEVEFTIGDPRFIMKTLAELYSSAELAVVREYSTNARDSHIMSGKAHLPIEVTLPGLYNPYFEVQDFGQGMSKEELKTIYTQFGNSTKRESNDTNGMLGFGSKSAIAYTNQFTVTAVKDGVQTSAVITRKDDWSIKLTVVSEKKTDARNGVKITVPVGNWASFAAKGKDFFRFWEPGTVLVNGEQPRRAVGEKIHEGLYFSSQAGTSYVVMGNVGYRIANPEALFRNKRLNTVSFVAYVPNGSVEFTPSREDLMYTEKTNKTLHKVIEDFENNILEQAKKEIESAPTAPKAWAAWNSWNEKLGSDLFVNLKWNDKKFIHQFPVKDTMKYKVPSKSGYSERYNTNSVRYWDIAKADKTLFVKNFYPNLNSGHKRKVREYFEHIQFDAEFVLFMEGEPECEFINWAAAMVISWDELKAAVPKKARTPQAPRPKRPKGLYDFFTIKGKTYEEAIPQGADVLYVAAQDAKTYSIKDALVNAGADESVVVVVLASNRIEKFKRENFAVREFVSWAKKKVVIDTETLLDDQSKLALNIGSNTRGWLGELDVDKVADPKWKNFKELLTYRKYSDKYQQNLNLARSMGMLYDVKQYNVSGEDETLLDYYPLLHSLSHWRLSNDMKAEIILYINAAYAAKKGS